MGHSEDSCMLGVDVGTGGCKAVVVDSEGRIISTASKEYSTSYPAAGWAEQNPEDWYSAFCLVVSHAASEAKKHGGIRSVCVDGQPHTPVFLNEDMEILRPAIPWTDTRSAAQVDRIREMLGQRVFEITCNPATTAFTLPQLMWVAEREPDVWKRTFKVQIAKDYVRKRISDCDWLTDHSDAIGTLMYDARKFTWSEEICEAFDMPVDKLPYVAPSAEEIGYITDRASRETGLEAGVPVVMGAHDPCVENLAAGVVRPGQSFIKLATAGVVSFTTAKPHPDLHGRAVTYCLPTTSKTADRWFTKTSTLSSGSSVRWFRDIFCKEEIELATKTSRRAYDLMDEMAAKVPLGSGGLVFHPYLIGEGSPYWDPYLKGSFFGVTLRHRREHFYRAVLEGVAFSLRDGLSVFEDLHMSTSEVRLIGGGSESKVWAQIVCDVLGTRLLKPLGGDASYGAALLGGVGVGIFKNIEEACDTCVRIGETLEPDPERHRRYDEIFKIYLGLQRQTSQISKQLHNLQAEY